MRPIEAREGKTRHSFQPIGHTAYLCFARKAVFARRRRAAAAAADPDVDEPPESGSSGGGGGGA